MVILKEGLNRIRDLISADIDYGQLGTATTALSENDTGLGTADAATVLAVTVTTADKQIKYDYTLPSTGGSTATYTEFELRKNATPVNYDRILFTGIGFVPDGVQDIVISKKWFIRNG